MSKKYGYSNKAIAQRLTLSENTVESQLTKAHLFMRRYKNVI
jgi:DNA-binding NarL/FixJ family response regulator